MGGLLSMFNAQRKRVQQGKLAQARAKFKHRQPGRLYLTGHRVWGTGIHIAIEFVGEVSVEWISAGTGDDNLLVSGQTLERPTDSPPKNFIIGEVTPPEGMTTKEYFNLLQGLETNYCQCVDYDVYPGMMDSYNSNSFVAGLINASGGCASFNLGYFYGGNKPLPSSYFERK
jgi:hypothetical protein